jgi:hypothetical protein
MDCDPAMQRMRWVKQITCLGASHASSSHIDLSNGSNSLNDFLDAVVCMYSPWCNAPRFAHNEFIVISNVKGMRYGSQLQNRWPCFGFLLVEAIGFATAPLSARTLTTFPTDLIFLHMLIWFNGVELSHGNYFGFKIVFHKRGEDFWVVDRHF